MSESLPAAVFDCTVFLQALANQKGPAFACWQLVDTGRVTLYLNPQVIAEVTEVLNRPELHQKFKTLTPNKVRVYLSNVVARATILADVPQRFTYPRDPKDEPYINLAIATGARYLVTRDKDMLDLMDETTSEGRDFRERFPGLMILDPVVFLRELAPRKA
jgi:putative PIN family toxin of toxin-antitoxin system